MPVCLIFVCPTAEEGIEAIHLFSGRTVCRLHLPTPGEAIGSWDCAAADITRAAWPPATPLQLVPLLEPANCSRQTVLPSVLTLSAPACGASLPAGLHVDLNGDGVPEHIVAAGAGSSRPGSSIVGRPLLLSSVCTQLRCSLRMPPHPPACPPAAAIATLHVCLLLLPAGGAMETLLEEGDTGHKHNAFCYMSGAR